MILNKQREQRQKNKEWWDEVVPVHLRAKEVYKIKELKAGCITLDNTEIKEIGIVKDKTLIHLQCHIGLDTLSWAKLGAQVTGVDMSTQAINSAREIANDTKTSCDFIELDIFDIPSSNLFKKQYDIVYTSYGILPWISDIEKWAEILYELTIKGGIFYMIDFHPIIYTIDIDYDYTIQIVRDYFHSNNPNIYYNEADYADPNYTSNKSIYTWNWSLGDVITSLSSAGFKINFLHEFNYSKEKVYSNLKKNELGYWYIPGFESKIPLIFSVKASK